MVKDLLVKLSLGEELDPKNPNHRTRLGVATGILGITLNILVTIAKVLIGIGVGSMVIVTDGIHNLTDAFSSIVSSVGMFLAGAPADEDHPHGHGRLEYLIALVIALVILVLGVLLFTNSIENIRNPSPVEFSWPAVLIVGLTILVKLLMYVFYKDIGEAINSPPLKAASLDSIGDTIVTFVVLMAYIFSNFSSFPVDGIGSFIVSLIIINSGIDMIIEMISELVSEDIDPELETEVESYFNRQGILGTHDLKIHKYGPAVTYATIDAVVDSDLSLEEAYNLLNEIKYYIYHDLGIEMTIEIDIVEEGPVEDRFREIIEEGIESSEYILSYHDEYLNFDNDQYNMGVHLVLDGNKVDSNKKTEEIRRDFKDYLSKYFPTYNIIVIIDRDFT